MGRINLAALRVRKKALLGLDSNLKSVNFAPVWLNITADVPPSQILTRQQPIQHPPTTIRTKTLPNGRTQQTAITHIPRRSKKARPSRMFSPLSLQYEEDTLRKTFFSDHPWELARPRVLVETSGDSHVEVDWSTGIQQPNLPLSGENVVQRQLYLLQNIPDISTAEAYDIARKEFYTERRREHTAMRIAVEEAENLGAKFGPSAMSKAMKIESKWYDDWEKWANVVQMENDQRNASFSGNQLQVENRALDETRKVEGVAGSAAGDLGGKAPMGNRIGSNTVSSAVGRGLGRDSNRVGRQL